MQPDSGTPVDPNDVVTKSYVDAAVSGSSGTPFQERFTGGGTSFMLTNLPLSNAHVKLYVNGSFQTQGVHYTISGKNITMTPAISSTQDLDADYNF